MRSLAWCLVVSTALTGLAPAPALAQNPEQIAVQACQAAVEREVRYRYPQADRVQFLSNDARQASNAETSVDGQAQFNARNGWSSFNYGCVYNIRNGATYGLDVRNVRLADNAAQPSEKKDNSGAVAGLLIGALVAGAIVASAKKKDKDRDGDNSWSPASGVVCYPRQSACYERGDFSRRWTKRIYYR